MNGQQVNDGLNLSRGTLTRGCVRHRDVHVIEAYDGMTRGAAARRAHMTKGVVSPK